MTLKIIDCLSLINCKSFQFRTITAKQNPIYADCANAWSQTGPSSDMINMLTPIQQEIILYYTVLSSYLVAADVFFNALASVSTNIRTRTVPVRTELLLLVRSDPVLRIQGV